MVDVCKFVVGILTLFRLRADILFVIHKKELVGKFCFQTSQRVLFFDMKRCA